MAAKKRNFRTLSSYCSDIFQDSLITGLSSILKSKGWLQKIAKIFILAFSVTGFLYQTFQFLQVYWEFSTVKSVTQADKMLRPAMTYCDNNLIRRSFFCKLRPEECHLGVAIDRIKKLEVLPDELFDFNVTKYGGFKFQDSLISCEWYLDADSRKQSDKGNILNCGTEEFVRVLDVERLPYACYALNSYRGKEHPAPIYFENDAVQVITFKWNTEEYIRDAKSAYALSFHNPEEKDNPALKQLAVFTDLYYKFHVHQETSIRLPPPYATRCYDYQKDWIKKDGKAPLNKAKCQAECEIKFQLEFYGCVSRDVILPHEEKICPYLPNLDMNLNWKIRLCKENCADACLEIHYVTTKEIIGQIPQSEALKKYNTSQVAVAEIEFNILRSKIISHRPKYESVELFSYIGGYLGMWLGWSLAAIFNFFGTLIRICQYPWKKKKQNKKIMKIDFNRYYYS